MYSFYDSVVSNLKDIELKDSSTIIYWPLRYVWSRFSYSALGKDSGL